MQHVFLSPHLDDIALSCGGRVIQLVNQGATLRVISVMTGKPPSGRLSDFALKTHRDWGEPEDILATRYAEDAQAMDLLGVEAVYLDWPDAMYRRGLRGEADWLYTSNVTLFGPLHPSEVHLIERLADELVGLIGPVADVQVYGPLGVGSHVDHLLVRSAVLRLWEQGYRVVLYEEIPYAMHPGQLASALAKLPLLPVGEVYILSESDFASRLRAVHCYRSQLVGVFGTFADTDPMLTDYGERVGAGAGLAERFWRLGSY